MQQAGADSRRENARPENEETKSFQFLHRAQCIYEFFLLGRDCFFFMDSYKVCTE